MNNQDLKIELVNSIAITHPELYQQLMNLSAQVPDDIKVSLNDTLSKIHVSNEQATYILQNLIDKLTAILDSIKHKNNYMLFSNSTQGPKPANLLVSHSEYPIIEEIHHELAQSKLITSKPESVIPKPEILSKHVSSTSGIITYDKRKYIYIGLSILLIIILIVKYKKSATS
jgi:hypothetical protein